MEIFQYMENRTIDLKDVFTTKPTVESGDLDTNFRRFGHLMEKKMSVWWDLTTHDQYIKENIVPRRLRWDLPIMDGLTDKDSIEEWYLFFNTKGMEVQQFLLKRKQRKMANINKQISECKTLLEGYKDSPSFVTLTNQLNKVLEQKDMEIKQRKKRKYLRDTHDYKIH